MYILETLSRLLIITWHNSNNTAEPSDGVVNKEFEYYVVIHILTSQLSRFSPHGLQNHSLGFHTPPWMSIYEFVVSTTAHGYHCAPTSTLAMFKETTRSETSLAEPPTSGGRVAGALPTPTPPLGGGGGGRVPLPWMSI